MVIWLDEWQDGNINGVNNVTSLKASYEWGFLVVIQSGKMENINGVINVTSLKASYEWDFLVVIQSGKMENINEVNNVSTILMTVSLDPVSRKEQRFCN